MKISVIVPVYNCEPYVQHCISSITVQTHHDLEIICVNDGSTDRSGEIIDALAREDPRIRVIHQKNSGASAARNTGIDLATGDLITFVDSDDELEPDMYETLLTLAMEHGADIAHCGYKKIYSDGTQKDVQGTGILLFQTGEEAAASLLKGEYFVGSLCNKLFSSALINHLRLDTELKINEDVLFSFQAFSRAKKTVFLDLPKYHYFERANSSCARTHSLKKSRDCVIAAQKMLDMHHGDQLEHLCARRVWNSLTGLYRTCLLTDANGTRQERSGIRKRVKSVAPLCGKLSFRARLNWVLLKYLPGLYRLTYRVYDRIRKPNWDL